MPPSAVSKNLSSYSARIYGSISSHSSLLNSVSSCKSDNPFLTIAKELHRTSKALAAKIAAETVLFKEAVKSSVSTPKLSADIPNSSKISIKSVSVNFLPSDTILLLAAFTILLIVDISVPKLIISAKRLSKVLKFSSFIEDCSVEYN